MTTISATEEAEKRLADVESLLRDAPRRRRWYDRNVLEQRALNLRKRIEDSRA